MRKKNPSSLQSKDIEVYLFLPIQGKKEARKGRSCSGGRTVLEIGIDQALAMYIAP